ncbi:uncharacterized protein LOC127137121 [Lathyrus oleraceus]|uniref:uncharacterized protein LOC127137121 n=1 Tax=Pisum sativum TaxID=3888 RepID=UPI0021CED4DD|nr:uncharacterized protein LOC127137121 [Pisum sativum]
MYQNSGKGSEKVNEPTNDGKEDESGEAKDKEPSYVPLPPYKPPILSNKKKLEDDETVMLTSEYSAIIQNNMPPKLKDPGMLKNVLVRIEQFYIPTKFVIMDIKEDSNIPIILGRPFLATVGAIIDVKKGRLTFEVGEEKVEFLLAKFLQAPTIDESCCS